MEEGGRGSSILSLREKKSGVVIGNLYDLEVPPLSRSGFAINRAKRKIKEAAANV